MARLEKGDYFDHRIPLVERSGWSPVFSLDVQKTASLVGGTNKRWKAERNVKALWTTRQTPNPNRTENSSEG